MIRRWLLDLLLRLGPCCGDINCTICGPTVERMRNRNPWIDDDPDPQYSRLDNLDGRRAG